MNVTRTAVVLAAGVGSRLRPLTDDKPKALVRVSGSTILRRAVDALSAYGVRRLVVATGYREDAIERALADSDLEILCRRNPEYDRTQNSVSLGLCRDALAGGAFFKLDGDLLFDPEILQRLDESEAELAAAVDSGAALDAEAMKVRFLVDGSIAEFGKGIPLAEARGESIGIERIAARAGERLFGALEVARRAGEVGLYYEDVYNRVIADGLRAEAVDVTGFRWCEVDAPPDLARAERLFP